MHAPEWCVHVWCVCGAVYVTGLSRSSSIYNFKQYMYYNILGMNLIYIGGRVMGVWEVLLHF